MVGLKNTKAAFIIASRDFQDEEYFIPKQILNAADITVTTVSTAPGRAIGVEGGEAKVNMFLDNLQAEDFDAIIFIGGPGIQKFLNDPKFHQVAHETVKNNKIIGAICIAPAMLAKAGILDGKKATVWSIPMNKSMVKILEEGGAIYQNEAVVRDGNIITADGPLAAEDFAKKIVESLS